MDWMIGTILVLLLSALASVLTMYLDHKDVEEDIDSFIQKKIKDGTKEETNKPTTPKKN